jgi:hypothetical protein
LGEKVALTWLAQNSTAVITIATVVYTLLTALIWFTTRENTSATRKVLEASHRPYLGVIQVQVDLLHRDSGQLRALVQNVGTAPSRIAKIDLHVDFNGKPTKETVSEIAFLPNQEHTVCCELGTEDIRLLGSPSEVIATVKISYQGMTRKRYQTETRCAYRAPGQPFFVISSSLE